VCVYLILYLLIKVDACCEFLHLETNKVICIIYLYYCYC
jgi:hypothetical protein